jgi:hypothetical protein
MNFSIFKSGTFWASVAWAAFHIASNPHDPTTVGEAVTAVIAVARGRTAIAKNGDNR